MAYESSKGEKQWIPSVEGNRNDIEFEQSMADAWLLRATGTGVHVRRSHLKVGARCEEH